MEWKLNDNKCNTFLLFWFKLLLYSQKHAFELCFWLRNFSLIETKIKKKVFVKQTKPNVNHMQNPVILHFWFYNWEKVNVD